MSNKLYIIALDVEANILAETEKKAKEKFWQWFYEDVGSNDLEIMDELLVDVE